MNNHDRKQQRQQMRDNINEVTSYKRLMQHIFDSLDAIEERLDYGASACEGPSVHYGPLHAPPLAHEPKKLCFWKRDPHEGGYDGACGISWSFEDFGTPNEHGMVYCPRCGNVLVQMDGNDPSED